MKQNNLSLRPSQYVVLRRLEKNKDGIPFEVWKKWKQPPIRGLFFRYMVDFSAKKTLIATTLGLMACAEYRAVAPSLREDDSRPVFRSKGRRARCRLARFVA